MRCLHLACVHFPFVQVLLEQQDSLASGCFLGLGMDLDLEKLDLVEHVVEAPAVVAAVASGSSPARSVVDGDAAAVATLQRAAVAGNAPPHVLVALRTFLVLKAYMK